MKIRKIDHLMHIKEKKPDRTLVKDTIDLYNDCIKLTGIEKISVISKQYDSLLVTLVKEYLKSKDTASRIKIFVQNPEAIKNVRSPRFLR